MKTLMIICAVVVVAAAAGFGGAYLQKLTEPQPVYAQRTRAKDGILIAICNIERAAKASKKFMQQKKAWNDAQDELKRQRDAIEREIDDVNAQMQRAGMDPNAKQEDMANLSIELETKKKKYQAAEDAHELYLRRLQGAFQNEVLKEVRTVVESYAQKLGYDIVLQDYTVEEAGGTGQFFDGSYAQTLLTKPVFFVPDLANNKNQYATDITDEVIKQLQ